jgi:hypothetical protein
VTPEDREELVQVLDELLELRSRVDREIVATRTTMLELGIESEEL